MRVAQRADGVVAVIVGQDRRYLAALIVPDRERLAEQIAGFGSEVEEQGTLIDHPEARRIIEGDIRERVSVHISRFVLLARSFEVGRELSQKLEVKRHAIASLYSAEIEALYR